MYIPMSVHYHLRNHEDAVIEVYSETDQTGSPYPVMTLGKASIFPSDEQLRQIQSAIVEYFAAKTTCPATVVVSGPDYVPTPLTAEEAARREKSWGETN